MSRAVQKIGEVKESITIVKNALPETFTKFQRLPKLQKDGIYKNVEFAIQNILDILAIIVKEQEYTVPSEDYSLITLLQEEGVIEKETADTLFQMKGFRNHLVHRYGKIHDKQAYTDIKEGIEPIEIIISLLKDLV